MAKLTKKAAILEKLHGLVNKEAELAQTNISGEPCKDTNVTSISESTETTDKNNVGPDKLNNEQGYEQKPSSDSSEPVAVAKSAEATSDVEKMANDILATIKTKIAENAQTNISGAPLKDTKATSVSDSTETTDKNNVGPDKLNDEQEYNQEGSKDSSEPSKAKKAEEQEKQASYNLGVAFCDALLKKAAEIKEAQEAEMLKEAGRRDLDLMIAQAAEELQTQNGTEQEKQAEVYGAAAFEALYKQAQLEDLAQKHQAALQKLAAYEEQEKQAAAVAAERKEEEKMAKIAATVAEILKRDLVPTSSTK